MSQLAKRAENGVITPQKFHGTLHVPHLWKISAYTPGPTLFFKCYRLIINSPDQL